jgi:hypothetical protein
MRSRALCFPHARWEGMMERPPPENPKKQLLNSILDL